MSKRDFIGIFGVIFLVIFIIVFSNFILAGNHYTFTFKGLLEFLGDIPDVDVSWAYKDFTIYANWGIWNFLRDFFNGFISIIEFWFFLTGCLWQLLNLLFYFLTNLFSFGITVFPGSGPGPSFGGR